MKLFSSTLVFGLSLVCGTLRAGSLLRPNDVVAIAGDSITQQKLYSVYIEDYLLMCQPVPGVRAVQFGKNGACAYVLGKHAPNDLALFHPTVVTTMFGMNDGRYQPINDPMAEGFREGMTGSVEALKKIGVRAIIIGSPSCVDWLANPSGRKMYNATLAALGEISREVARQQCAVFADVHAEMGEAIARGEAIDPGFDLGGGGTHVGPIGQLMIAYPFLKAMGCDGAIGTITVDLAKNHAEGTAGQKILSVREGAIEVESTRYPFCFEGDPEKHGTETANALKVLPFNEDLNRYLLVVYGLKTGRAKVTWGARSREFAAEELEKGVNLAAAFVPENPFSGQFARVDAAVREKQTQETALTWKFLIAARTLRTILPDEEPTLDRIQKEAFEQNRRLAQASASLVIPLRHTIKIEPVL